MTAGLAALALLIAACDDAEEATVDPDPAGTDEDQAEQTDDVDGDTDDPGDEPEEAAGPFCDDVGVIEFLVPFGAGGGTDTLARMIEPFFTERLGVPAQVVNVPGGGSVVGANDYVHQGEPDGANILFPALRRTPHRRSVRTASASTSMISRPSPASRSVACTTCTRTRPSKRAST